MSSFWRPVARVSAWIDLVLQTFVLLSFSLNLLYRYEFDHVVNYFGVSIKMWGWLTLCLLIQGIQVWAAVQLVFATKIGINPNNARGKSFAWAVVRFIFFLVYMVVECFFLQNILGLLIAVWHGGSLLIVCFFMYNVE